MSSVGSRLQPGGRQNVVLELGSFTASLGCNPKKASKFKLAKVLQAAGLDVNLNKAGGGFLRG